MTPRPHVGTLLAQFEPSSIETYRERFVDTMLLCRKTERLGVQHLGDYSARHCNYSSLRITNQPAFKHVVMHRTVGLIEPRCNTCQMDNGSTRPQQSLHLWSQVSTGNSTVMTVSFSILLMSYEQWQQPAVVGTKPLKLQSTMSTKRFVSIRKNSEARMSLTTALVVTVSLCPTTCLSGVVTYCDTTTQPNLS